MKKRKRKNNYCYIFLTLLLQLSTACVDKQSIRIDDFDQLTWKEDFQGCLEKRKEIAAQIVTIKHKFIGHDEVEIRNVLGKPNMVELAERNKKYYYYYVTRGKQCTEDTTLLQGKRLRVRFNALNQVDEVILEK